jgi:hypothetical protein
MHFISKGDQITINNIPENYQYSEPTNSTIFCPMNKPSTSFFINKWKSIPKTYENLLTLGKMFTSKEKDIIVRLQANNIIVCLFRIIANTVFYF